MFSRSHQDYEELSETGELDPLSEKGGGEGEDWVEGRKEGKKKKGLPLGRLKRHWTARRGRESRQRVTQAATRIYRHNRYVDTQQGETNCTVHTYEFSFA